MPIVKLPETCESRQQLYRDLLGRGPDGNWIAVTHDGVEIDDAKAKRIRDYEAVRKQEYDERFADQVAQMKYLVQDIDEAAARAAVVRRMGPYEPMLELETARTEKAKPAKSNGGNN